MIPEQQQVNASQHAAAPAAEAPRRRRRANAHTRYNKQTPGNPRTSTYELFRQQSAKKGVVVSPASSSTSLPPEALADPTEALNPGIRRIRRSTYSTVEQRLAAQFQPFRDSFQHVAQQLSARQQQQQLNSSDASAEAAAPNQTAEHGLDSGVQELRRASRRINRLTQLFSVPADDVPSVTTAATSAKKVTHETPDILAQQPDESRQAVQRLANILLEQQRLHKQQQQQEGEGAPDQQNHQGYQQQALLSDASVSSKLRPARIVSPSGSQLGATRLYMPAPSANDAVSPADRQPLQLLSVRQLQQMQQEARQQAYRKVRVFHWS